MGLIESLSVENRKRLEAIAFFQSLILIPEFLQRFIILSLLRLFV